VSKAQFARLVSERYRHVYADIHGRRRRIDLDFSNDVRLEDGRGQTIPAARYSPLTKFLLKNACAFHWQLGGKVGIVVVPHQLLLHSIAGSKSAHNIIRDSIAREIERKTKA